MNAGKAQLNVAEYEGPLLAILLFLHIQGSQGVLVGIVSVIAPLSQAMYFWGRALSGKVFIPPWGPLGAVSRYVALGIVVYLLC